MPTVNTKYGFFYEDLPPEYHVWRGMRRRIHDGRDPAYEHYGGRGIEICEDWDRDDVGFANFIRDMGYRPDAQHSIDRIDNDGDYTKENCRWATWEEQNNNQRKRNGSNKKRQKQKEGQAALQARASTDASPQPARQGHV